MDQIGAAMLLVEIGTDMDAFGSADRLASWAGVCPGNNESAGKRKSGHMRRGNRYVRRLLCEFAHAASRTQSVFKSKFQALVIRRGHKRAISGKTPGHHPTSKMNNTAWQSARKRAGLGVCRTFLENDHPVR